MKKIYIDCGRHIMCTNCPIEKLGLRIFLCGRSETVYPCDEIHCELCSIRFICMTQGDYVTIEADRFYEMVVK